MIAAISNLISALQSGRMVAVMGALEDVRRWLGYEPKPPYHEMVESRAGLRFGADPTLRPLTVKFTARLYLHYTSVRAGSEGLVFAVRFSGTDYSDSPFPPVEELFPRGSVDSFEVYGYGSRWKGQAVSTPEELLHKLEIPPSLNRLSVQEFLLQI
jgi:hypothetical protein